MRRRMRAAVWGLIAIGVISWTVVVVIGAFNAHSDTAFNGWVGWATIAAVPIAAAGVLPVLWDKITAEGDSAAGLRATEDELCRVVLSQAQTARSRLIGPGEPGDEAANVPFDRSLRFCGVGGASGGELASLLAYYQSLSPQRLVVLGEPGAGKTVLALELQVRLLETRDLEPDAPVPVLISAAAYDADQPWEKWLTGHLALRFGLSKKTAARLVRDGRILLLIDGLDEMDPAGADEPQRARILVSSLNAAMRGHERAPVVVTCRRSEYDALGRGIERATHIEMSGLTGDEAASYLRSQLHTPAEVDRWEPVLANLDEDPYGALATEMATPWRLTLALAVFRNAGDPAVLLPPASVTGSGYSRYLDSLLLKGYVPSVVRLHADDTPYSEPQVRQWLTALADGLAWQSRHGLSATDIVPHQWWRPAGQHVTRSIHVAMATLPAIVLLITTAVTRSEEFMAPGIISLLVGFLSAEEQPPRRVIVNITALRGVPVVAMGLMLGLARGPVVGLAIGLGSGLVAGIKNLSPYDRGPLAILRADGISGAMVGLATGLTIFGVAIGLENERFASGLALGLATGLTIGLTAGGWSWVRYRIAVAVLAVRGQGPMRLGTFFDWAAGAGLLRVSGVAYQFRHRQLQDWLTAQAAGTVTRPPIRRNSTRNALHCETLFRCVAARLSHRYRPQPRGIRSQHQ